MDIVRTLPPKRFGFATRAAAVGAAAAIALFALVWRTSAAPAPAVERASVWTERVKRGDFLRQVPVQGTLVPEHVQWLSAETAARVARIAVRPGAEVETDTVVLVLENAELELAALEAERQAAAAESALVQLDVKTLDDQKSQEASLASLHADLQNAQRRASAADRLAPEGLMSDLDFRDAHFKAQGLEGRVQTEEARGGLLHQGRQRQLESQRAQLARLRDIAAFRRRQLAALQLRAGVRGVVQDVPLENGQWVAIGTLLAKIAEPKRLKADVKVAEANAKDLHRGLAVRFDSPSGTLRGKIERVDPAVVGGSVRLEVTLDDATPAGARADQTVSGFVEIEKVQGALFVARPAGAEDGQTFGAYRLDPDGAHASRVAARLGKSSVREVEILGGLAEGDEIIVSDTSGWDASGRVRLK